jgi:peroxiredoxin
MNTPTIPPVGEPAPDFSLAATDGASSSLGDFAGRQNCGVEVCPEEETPGGP